MLACPNGLQCFYAMLILDSLFTNLWPTTTTTTTTTTITSFIACKIYKIQKIVKFNGLVSYML